MSVRPMGSNILDIWDDMMRPFEAEEIRGDNQETGIGNEGGDSLGKDGESQRDEEGSIQSEGEEGAAIRMAKAE